MKRRAYKISKAVYNMYLNGVQDGKGGWLIKPLNYHRDVIDYILADAGLLHVQYVITD